MRKYDIAPGLIHKLWTPQGGLEHELDLYPRCYRCSKKMGRSVPIEAYKIVDIGDKRIDVAGRCMGRCWAPNANEPTEPKNVAGRDNWTDVVRIGWDKYTPRKTEEMFMADTPDARQFQTDIAKHISSIVFFEPFAEDVV